MPPTSGFQIDDEALKLYGDMKLGSKDTRYFTMSVDKDAGLIKIVDRFKKTSDQEADFTQMLTCLSDSNCLFIILDMSVESKTGATKDQLFIISW